MSCTCDKNGGVVLENEMLVGDAVTRVYSAKLTYFINQAPSAFNLHALMGTLSGQVTFRAYYRDIGGPAPGAWQGLGSGFNITQSNVEGGETLASLSYGSVSRIELGIGITCSSGNGGLVEWAKVTIAVA